MNSAIGVILIEHRLELLSAIADRVVVLDLGKVIAEGVPGEVFCKIRQCTPPISRTSNMPEVLTISGLSAGYGALRVLHEVDFHVEEGERVGLGRSQWPRQKHAVARRHVAGRLAGWFHSVSTARKSAAPVPPAPGRRTHAIVRMGVALTPQGDAIFPGLTVAQHLDCGAYSSVAWRERAERRHKVMDIFPPLRKL